MKISLISATSLCALLTASLPPAQAMPRFQAAMNTAVLFNDAFSDLPLSPARAGEAVLGGTLRDASSTGPADPAATRPGAVTLLPLGAARGTDPFDIASLYDKGEVDARKSALTAARDRVANLIGSIPGVNRDRTNSGETVMTASSGIVMGDQMERSASTRAGAHESLYVFAPAGTSTATITVVSAGSLSRSGPASPYVATAAATRNEPGLNGVEISTSEAGRSGFDYTYVPVRGLSTSVRADPAPGAEQMAERASPDPASTETRSAAGQQTIRETPRRPIARRRDDATGKLVDAGFSAETPEAAADMQDNNAATGVSGLPRPARPLARRLTPGAVDSSQVDTANSPVLVDAGTGVTPTAFRLTPRAGGTTTSLAVPPATARGMGRYNTTAASFPNAGVFGANPAVASDQITVFNTLPPAPVYATPEMIQALLDLAPAAVGHSRLSPSVRPPSEARFLTPASLLTVVSVLNAPNAAPVSVESFQISAIDPDPLRGLQITMVSPRPTSNARGAVAVSNRLPLNGVPASSGALVNMTTANPRGSLLMAGPGAGAPATGSSITSVSSSGPIMQVSMIGAAGTQDPVSTSTRSPVSARSSSSLPSSGTPSTTVQMPLAISHSSGAGLLGDPLALPLGTRALLF